MEWKRLVLVTITMTTMSSPAREATIRLEQNDDGAVDVTIGGAPFATYHARGVDRPYFFPVYGPTGKHMTRQWPMAEGSDEQHDHPHHRGLWFSHGDMNGHDFWTEGKGPKIVQTKLSLAQEGVLTSENAWISADGTTICTDRRVHRFSGSTDCRQIDLDITLIASEGRLIMGDTKEGCMALRVPAPLRVKGRAGRGHILTSEGTRDANAWGTRAAWCSYAGPIGGEIVGVTIMDHPSNPQHPTWWHVRTYGLMAANPVGRHDFENAPPGTGNLTIESGQSVRFRYRLLFHVGDKIEATLDERYQAYCRKRRLP